MLEKTGNLYLKSRYPNFLIFLPFTLLFLSSLFIGYKAYYLSNNFQYCNQLISETILSKNQRQQKKIFLSMHAKSKNSPPSYENLTPDALNSFNKLSNFHPILDLSLKNELINTKFLPKTVKKKETKLTKEKEVFAETFIVEDRILWTIIRDLERRNKIPSPQVIITKATFTKMRHDDQTSFWKTSLSWIEREFKL